MQPFRFRGALAAAALACAAVLAPAAAHAQRDTVPAAADSVVTIRLADGSVLYGRIVSDDGGRVVVQTQGGARVELARTQIRSIEPLGGRLVNGEVWTADPNGTRLFFGPTGRTLPAGTGQFAVYELVLPFVSVAAGDRVTLSAGTPVIPGAIGKAFYAEAKVQAIAMPTLHASVGALAFATDEDDEAAGVLYAVATAGTEDRAVTVSAGFPFVTGDRISQTPAIQIGGEYRVSRRIKLMSENYFVPGETGTILSGGVRIFGERLSADAGLGFGVGAGCDEQCIIPLVNFAYSFGKRRR